MGGRRGVAVENFPTVLPFDEGHAHGSAKAVAASPRPRHRRFMSRLLSDFILRGRVILHGAANIAFRIAKEDEGLPEVVWVD
jgi:hypothetical protein